MLKKKIVAGIALKEDLRFLLENFLFDTKYFFEHIDLAHYTPEIFNSSRKPYAVIVEENSIVVDDVRILGKARKVPVIIIGNEEKEGKLEECVYVLNLPLFSVKLINFLDSLESHKERVRYITTKKPLHGKKILVFEDSKFLAESLKEILINEGAEVRVEKSTKNFAEKIKSYSPDVIILDLVIEPHDGFEVLDSLKNDEELGKIPVVVASVKSQLDDQKTSYLLGAEEFLPKPFQPVEVRKVITRVLARS